MIPYPDVLAALGRTANPTERRVHFAALLSKVIGTSKADLIVVGGSAIEIYTSAEYTTGDIDVVAKMPENLKDILVAWRFEKVGRVWANDELGLVVDIVNRFYTGDETRTQIVTTVYGPIRVAAIEDLLVKRLASAKHWRMKGDLEHAKMLAVLYGDRIDWNYVERFASKYDVSDVLSSLRKAMSQVQR